MLENDTTIEQQIAIWHRSTYDANDVELLGVVKQLYHSLFSSHKEGLLGKEILTRIACERQFGKHHNLNTFGHSLK